MRLAAEQHSGNLRLQAHVVGLIILVDDRVGLASATADFDGGNLLLEPASLLGSLCLFVTPDAVLVLVLTGEGVVVGALLALKAHVLFLVGVGQAILEDTINEGLVAELCASAEVGKVVRDVGHGLGASGNDNVGSASKDGLGADDDGLDTRGAHLVHCGADGGLLETSAEGALAGRVLSEATEGQIRGVAVEVEIDGRYLAERTLPKTTSSTDSGLMPALSTAAGQDVSAYKGHRSEWTVMARYP